MYVKLSADGSYVLAVSEYPHDGFIETEREIVRAWNGVLYFAGEEPEQTPEELADKRAAVFNASVNARLDAFAGQKGYDNMVKARLATLTADYAADGAVANTAYNNTWTEAIALIPQVRSGELSVEQALSRLPALAWN
jgi:hypothetical protein